MDDPEYVKHLDPIQFRVLHYIVRHTLGYKNDPFKKLTLDEIQNGRKTKNGQLAGTYLSRSSIIRALNYLIYHNYLECRQDRRDKARVETYYHPVTDDSEFGDPPKNWTELDIVSVDVDEAGNFKRSVSKPPVRTCLRETPAFLIDTPGVSERTPVHKKETKKENKEGNPPISPHDASHPGGLGDEGISSRKEPDPTNPIPGWIERIREIARVLRKNNLSPEHWKTSENKLKTLMKQYPASTIESVLAWYEEHWRDVLIRCTSVSTFCKHFSTLCDLVGTDPGYNLGNYQISKDVKNNLTVRDILEGDWDWPEAAKKDLESYLMAVYLDCQKIYKPLAGALVKLKKVSRDAHDVLDCRFASFRDPDHLVYCWCCYLRYLKMFDSWNGNLGKHRFSLKGVYAWLEHEGMGWAWDFKRLVRQLDNNPLEDEN